MSFCKTKIDWPGLTHSWDPVVGCKRGCRFCYANTLHTKRHNAYLNGKLQNCKQYALPFTNMQFFPQRLDKAPPKNAKRIFVGDMTDIQYWNYDWTRRVLDYCSVFDRCEYMFLSKSCLSYCDFYWPKNTMQGMTLTCELTSPKDQARFIYAMTFLQRPFLSIEPLLGTFCETDLSKIELVICGAETGKGAKPPCQSWIDSVKNNVPPEKLWWKNNIKKYLAKNCAECSDGMMDLRRDWMQCPHCGRLLS